MRIRGSSMPIASGCLGYNGTKPVHWASLRQGEACRMEIIAWPTYCNGLILVIAGSQLLVMGVGGVWEGVGRDIIS